MAINDELKKKSLKAIKEKFGDVKSFKKAFKEKLPDFSSEKLKRALADDREKGNKKYRKIIIELLGFDIYNDESEKPKKKKPKKEEKTERQIKAEEEKQAKLMLTIEGLQKGEDIPKTAMFQINMKKSNLGIQNNGKNWVLNIDDEENGVLVEAQMNQRDKDAFRGCREVVLILIGR